MKLKLFYGWYIVAASAVMSAYFSSFLVYGWTAFLGPIVTTFGWSMTELSLGSSLRTLESGVFNTVWGPVVDRWSPRKLMILGLTGTAAGILCLSQTRNLAMYYAGFLIIGLGSSLVTQMLPLTIISRWFRKDMGKANGIYYVGVAIGGVMVPVVVKIIDRFGWQPTLLYAAIGLLVLGIPLTFVIRSRPEEYGLLHDGREHLTNNGSRSFQLYDFGTSVKEVLKTRAFWHLGVVNLWQYSVYATVSLYAMPYLTGLGMDRSTAGLVISLYTLISIFSRIPMGTLSDVFRKSHVITLSAGMMCAGLLIFWLIGSESPFWLVLLFAIIYGLGLGGLSPLRAPILVEYFGTKNFATIFGITSLFGTIAQVSSQPLAGWIFDLYHDYKISWLILLAFAALGLIAIMTIPPAKTKSGIQLEPREKGLISNL